MKIPTYIYYIVGAIIAYMIYKHYFAPRPALPAAPSAPSVTTTTTTNRNYQMRTTAPRAVSRPSGAAASA